MRYITALTALSLAYSSSVAFDELQLGLVGFADSKPYKSVSSEAQLFPFIKARYGMVYFEGLDFGVDAWENERVALKAGISLGTYGYKAKDGAYLSGMKTKRPSLDGDFRAKVTLSKTSYLTIRLSPDISNQHNGYGASAQYTNVLFQKDAHHLSGFIKAEYLSDKKADYYFGVASKESSAERKAYKVGNAINPSVGINYAYALSKHWTFLGGVKYVHLDSTIYKSPLVEDHEDISAYLGFMYRFF
ncbi:MipA/OmpV family protein [Sulfurospirillum sp. T05]|uniref:MipA/OmpV family protein n=1 Tax=Sulfurospirillum tamanense TaxID=2813362 RepID=A0ABS2WSV3_9BACT|nr:MipA/OmpV family protein [Sulfurospirillum tamanensis]MBN2964702.1 MipA/OmpV family protein [Sulfurospirillum tamanensis]